MTANTLHHATEKHENNCIVCQSKTNYFFSKTFPTYPGSPFTDDLKADYWKCEYCGFVISKTHQEMTSTQWSKLNTSYHHYFESSTEAQIVNQPPYADQALALTILRKNNIIDADDALDYAAGYGTLSDFLLKHFDIRIKIFDRYVRSGNKSVQYLDEESLGKYRLVISSAMFEHVLERDALNEVDNLVADDGVLMLHTLICERIPMDPDWFYVAPIVHTAFHTNKSMAILMEQWGYVASIYSPKAKSWFLFKNNYAQLSFLEARISSINRELQNNYFSYKAGFVDYWKGFRSSI